MFLARTWRKETPRGRACANDFGHASSITGIWKAGENEMTMQYKTFGSLMYSVLILYSNMETTLTASCGINVSNFKWTGKLNCEKPNIGALLQWRKAEENHRILREFVYIYKQVTKSHPVKLQNRDW